MPEIVDAQVNRARQLDKEVIINLGQVAAPDAKIDSPALRGVYDALPIELTLPEVDTLGERFASWVKEVSPANVRFSEIKVVYWLGHTSLARAHDTTYESAREHLKSLNWRGQRAALALWYERKFK